MFVAVLCVGEFSGAHINPAVTIGLAAAGTFDWDQVPGYVLAQMAGGILGGMLVYAFYAPHYRVTDDGDAKLATFCTAPEIRNPGSNFFSEVIGTFVLVYAVLLTVPTTLPLSPNEAAETVQVGLGALGALPVGLVVFSIGLSLGGTTGYAINPARDLGPRIAHMILPIFPLAATATGRMPRSRWLALLSVACWRRVCFSPKVTSN